MNGTMRVNHPDQQFKHLPPHSVDAEQCLIGSLMLDAGLFDEVDETLPAGAFYLADHQIIFDVIAERRRAGKHLDAVIVREELKRRGLLEEVGSTAYLAEILEAVPSAANGREYCDVVLRTFRQRELIAVANEALRQAYAPLAEPEEIATTLASKAECIRDTGGADPTVTLHQAVTESVGSLRGQKPRRLLTGLNEGDPDFVSAASLGSFDGMTGGIPLRGTTIVGGRPGSGKSAFVKSVLIRLAQRGHRVGIVTIEEDRVKIGDNALAHEGGVENWKIQRDVVTEGEHAALRSLAAEFRDLPFWIDDTCSTLTQVENSLRRLKRKYACDVLVVDHLHLIQHDSGRRNESRNDQITVISGRIKSLYRRLGVAGVVVCQLNRQGEGIDNIPSLTTLREGGALEQDGDLIVFLHRRDYYRGNPATTDDQPEDHKIEINVAKNKAGYTGMTLAYWDGHHQHVGDWNEGRGPLTHARAERETQEHLSYLDGRT